jgi:site-specific recombinase XerD
MSVRQLARVVRETAREAGISNSVSPQTLRHSFDTDRLEHNVDTLGHAPNPRLQVTTIEVRA